MEKLSNKNLLLINETFIVDHSVTEQWSQWVLQNLIKAVQETSLASNVMFSKIVHSHNPDGISYALQFIVEKENLEMINKNENLTRMRMQMFDLFRNKIASFKTEMEVIND
jgi:uncharacterized protein YqcC (DUF446 family)